MICSQSELFPSAGNCLHKTHLVHNFIMTELYSETSEEGTLWDRSVCPLFGGCPFLGGWSLVSVLSHNWNSGDLQHPNNGYCKRCFMLGDLLLCEGLPCLQESVGACKRGGFTY